MGDAEGTYRRAFHRENEDFIVSGSIRQLYKQSWIKKEGRRRT